MKVITIKQPYASLIVYGYKKFEFRSWKTNYRGKILIHAGLAMDQEAYEKVKHLPIKYNHGCIIGSVEIIDCTKLNNKLLKVLNEQPNIYGINNDYNGYIWKLYNPKVLEKPIHIKGKLGLWNYNEYN